MCQSPYKQIRAGWSFLVKCSHFNFEWFAPLSYSFCPENTWQGMWPETLHPCIPHLGTPTLLLGTGTSPWRGLLERQSMTFNDFYCFSRASSTFATHCEDTDWLRCAFSKAQLDFTHGTNSAALPQAKLLLTESCSIWGHWESGLLSKNHEVSKTHSKPAKDRRAGIAQG